MNPRAIALLVGAVVVGLGSGYLVTNDLLPWWALATALVAALGITVWFIRDQVRTTLAAQAERRRAKRAAKAGA